MQSSAHTIDTIFNPLAKPYRYLKVVHGESASTTTVSFISSNPCRTSFTGLSTTTPPKFSSKFTSQLLVSSKIPNEFNNWQIVELFENDLANIGENVTRNVIPLNKFLFVENAIFCGKLPSWLSLLTRERIFFLPLDFPSLVFEGVFTKNWLMLGES
ncbi:hypothetical protein AYI69_g6755 [Smittium culicis]|uniref:Uncharacterized protein n=1 Tax=Smittium culicis TaxID=133412 RepID=A0A1R1XX14_9FUNG|nr:hypothetical protein AYI69_g6755 [Smittium culicis]